MLTLKTHPVKGETVSRGCSGWGGGRQQDHHSSKQLKQKKIELAECKNSVTINDVTK